jgi:hypothetical protein
VHRICLLLRVGGYVIEGHGPAGVIRRLLAERPQATGIAVAGMPSSAPGMDVSGASEHLRCDYFQRVSPEKAKVVCHDWFDLDQ